MTSVKSAILYQNEEKTVTLIDIPTSITLAQVLAPQSPDRTILSYPPVQEPYPSTEPKSEAARARVLSRLGPLEQIYDYSTFIRNGLQEIRQAHQSRWCVLRQISPHVSPLRRKRKIQGLEASNDGLESGQEPQISPQQIAAGLDQTSTSPCSYIVRAKGHLAGIQNPTSASADIALSFPQTTFQIPPKAGAILSSINHETWWAFSEEVSRLYPASSTTAGPGQFDFILLDPPWENRSVTRSAKYKIMRDDDPLNVLRTELDQHIAPEALVACWITNRPSIRTAAMECFEAWNIKLIEEWVWIKTTVSGKPVYVVDGLWRKPYEVMLLGRRPKSEGTSASTGRSSVEHVLRRLIAGVPDLHSRKPCLRELIKPMMKEPEHYRALEVFARNMTAGWLTYGDEALKFNWHGHWTSSSGPTSSECTDSLAL
ncbi:hypothetical protein MMC13_006348 [Lambiella insularis]|nr:hypothetical protein [Lambiella insularis]